MTSYYVGINGQQQGPFSVSQLEVMYQTKKLQLTDLCWSEGMSEWLPISQALPEIGVQHPEEFNPYQAPRTLPTAAEPQLKSYYGGINRITYFLFNFVLAITSAFTQGNLAVMVIILVLSLAIVALRMKNIGMNPWLSLLSMVPILNLLIAYRCIACQEGFADSQKLDSAGRVITWIFGIFLVLVLGALAFSILSES